MGMRFIVVDVLSDTGCFPPSQKASPNPCFHLLIMFNALHISYYAGDFLFMR